jgi:MoxR-like ATPase
MAAPVLAHRLVLTAEAQAGRSADELVRSLVQRVPVPRAPAPSPAGGRNGTRWRGHPHDAAFRTR